MKFFLHLLVTFPIAIYAQSNVGIGTDTPQSKLDILSTGDGAELLRISTERPWVFKQHGAGSSATLAFSPQLRVKT